MPLCVYTGVIFLRSSTTPCPISEAAAFTVFLNASGRCISPSVQASPKILFPLLLIHRSNLCIQPLCGFLFVALKGSTMRRVAFSHRWVIFAVCFYMDPGCVAYPCVHIMTTGEKKTSSRSHREPTLCSWCSVWMLNLGCCFMLLDLRSVFNAVFFLPSQLFWKMLKECLLQRL